MLKIHEIFCSISGELGGVPQGKFVTFIRFDGCNLKCAYCDTAKTQAGINHTLMSVEEILKKVDEIGCHHVLLTGGEPLMHPIEELCAELDARGYYVQIETNGSRYRDIPGITAWVFDYKLGQVDSMMLFDEFKSIAHEIRAKQGIMFVKIPVWDDETYLQAVTLAKFFKESRIIVTALSAVPPMTPAILGGMLLRDKKFWIVLNCQLHKLINMA